LEVIESERHSSLLQHGIYYSRKKINDTGHRGLCRKTFYSCNLALKGLKASMDIRKYSCDNLKKKLRYPQLRKVSLNNFSQQGPSSLNNRRKLIR
jgi:hypothetical protein